MKLKNLLMTIGLTLAATTAVVVGVASNKSQDNMKAVEATVYPQKPTIYFVPSDNWKADNAVFKMKYFNTEHSEQNDEVTGTKLTEKYNGRDVYKFVVSSNSSYPNQIQFRRMNPSNTNQQWNYSNQFNIHDGYGVGMDTLVMDSDQTWWDTWYPGCSDGGKEVFWVNSQVRNVNADDCKTPSSSTTRLFVYNTDTHWASGGETVIEATGGSANVTTWSGTAKSAYNLTWMEDDNGTYYGYADIPLNITGFRIAQYNTKDSERAYMKDSTYHSQDLTLAGTADRVIYCPNDGNTVTMGGAHNDTCGASLMKKVLAAIDTCSDNVYNGYKAYANLNNFFYSHTSASVQSQNATTLGGSSMTIAQHMAAISDRNTYGLNKSNLGLAMMSDNSNNMMLIVAFSAIALVSAAGFFFLKKKRA